MDDNIYIYIYIYIYALLSIQNHHGYRIWQKVDLMWRPHRKWPFPGKFSPLSQLYRYPSFTAPQSIISSLFERIRCCLVGKGILDSGDVFLPLPSPNACISGCSQVKAYVTIYIKATKFIAKISGNRSETTSEIKLLICIDRLVWLFLRNWKNLKIFRNIYLWIYF